MNGPPKDPARRALPPADWPGVDQRAWEAASTPGSLFRAPGAAAVRAHPTRIAWAGAYGRFLTWLSDHSRMDMAQGLSCHFTAANVSAYAEWLCPRLKSLSLWTEINSLYRFAKATTPDIDLAWLRQAVNRLHAAAHPEIPIFDRLEDPRRLWALGIRLMDESDKNERIPGWKRASRYRDGLMLALLSARPLRLGNLTHIVVGTNLLRGSTGFTLRYTKAETKTRRWREWPVPAELTARIERYLAIYRPILLGDNESPRFWINKDGAPFNENGLLGRLKKVTRRLFGKPLTTRIVRHSVATAIDDEIPAQNKIIPPLLGHTQLATAEKYYTSQRMRTAVEAHAKNLEEIHQELALQPDSHGSPGKSKARPRPMGGAT